MGISYEGIGEVLATFQVEEDIAEGVVTMTDMDTVGLGTAGDLPCGVLLGVESDGMGLVQLGGLVKVKYTGTAPVAGYNLLACDGQGGITVNDGGIQCLVVCVDEADKTAVIKL